MCGVVALYLVVAYGNASAKKRKKCLVSVCFATSQQENVNCMQMRPEGLQMGQSELQKGAMEGRNGSVGGQNGVQMPP